MAFTAKKVSLSMAFIDEDKGNYTFSKFKTNATSDQVLNVAKALQTVQAYKASEFRKIVEADFE